MICWLQDFFKNWAVAVEALATVALVGVAIFQWCAMRNTNKTMAEQAQQERDRWKREDEILVEENKPKYRFGVVLEEAGPYLWIGNLGVTSFIVKTVFVNRMDIRSGQPQKLPPAPLEWNEVVAKGQKKNFSLPRELWTGDLIPSTSGESTAHECEIALSLESVDGSHIANKKKFTMYSENGVLALHIQRMEY